MSARSAGAENAAVDGLSQSYGARSTDPIVRFAPSSRSPSKLCLCPRSRHRHSSWPRSESRFFEAFTARRHSRRKGREANIQSVKLLVSRNAQRRERLGHRVLTFRYDQINHCILLRTSSAKRRTLACALDHVAGAEKLLPNPCQPVYWSVIPLQRKPPR